MSSFSNVLNSMLKSTAALSLALAPIGVAFIPSPAFAEDKVEAPPDAPIMRGANQRPIAFRSFASQLNASNDDNQGSMTWSEWWYSYEGPEAKYIVGVAQLTVAPNSTGLTNWNELEDVQLQLKHDAEGCTHNFSAPDPNSQGIQAQAGGTVTRGGSEGGVSAGASVGVDGVFIDHVRRRNTDVMWIVDIDDVSSTANSGFSSLLFVAEWRCPKSTNLNALFAYGHGNVQIDDWGTDTDFGFHGVGEVDGEPVGDATWLTYIAGKWVRVRPQQEPKSETPKSVGLVPPTETQDSRVARLNAVGQLRTGQAGSTSGTQVQYGAGSARHILHAGSDVDGQMRDVALMGRRDRVDQAGMRTATGTPMTTLAAPAASPVAMMASGSAATPVETIPEPAPARTLVVPAPTASSLVAVGSPAAIPARTMVDGTTLLGGPDGYGNPVAPATPAQNDRMIRTAPVIGRAPVSLALPDRTVTTTAGVVQTGQAPINRVFVPSAGAQPMVAGQVPNRSSIQVVTPTRGLVTGTPGLTGGKPAGAAALAATGSVQQ